MKPLGLDGKVGAPSIVKTNPFTGGYDELCAAIGRSMFKGHDTDIRRFFEQVGPFVWNDALEFTQAMYDVGNRRGLNTFLSFASERVPDGVLLYDLSTPDLDIHFNRPSGAPRVALLRGEYRSVTGNHIGIVTAHLAGVLGGREADTTFIYASPATPALSFRGASILVTRQASWLQHPAPGTVPKIERSSLASMMMSMATMEPESAFAYVEEPPLLITDDPVIHPLVMGVCAPDATGRTRRLYDRLRSLAADPAAFVRELDAVRSSGDQVRRWYGWWFRLLSRIDPPTDGGVLFDPTYPSVPSRIRRRLEGWR